MYLGHMWQEEKNLNVVLDSSGWEKTNVLLWNTMLLKAFFLTTQVIYVPECFWKKECQNENFSMTLKVGLKSIMKPIVVIHDR